MQNWQMYLHGPHIRARDRAEGDLTVPPLYVFGTFVDKIYRFENFSLPNTEVGKPPQPITAIQKVVGHVLAPSTGFAVEDTETKKLKGLLVAEGQPFFVDMHMPPKEAYLGGVQYLPMGHKANCSQLFPDPKNMMGKVVNTIDCHRPTGICFFSVWNFYDDQEPIWSQAEKMFGNDCLFYCITAVGSLDDFPTCEKYDVVKDETGEPICHKKGVGAVHGFTVGNTDPHDENKFDLLLVFTGKAEMTNGESSMKKVAVEMVRDANNSKDIKVTKSEPFAVDLFTKYAPQGWDVGGDHAWVDETGKYVWISCFRQKGVGAHMVRYDTGELIYSVTGLDKYVPDQYTYTAGIHGIGTIGKKGSYLVIATCSCHDINMCIPTVPWHWPVPKTVWSSGVLFVVDLSSMQLHPKVEMLHI
eukprot:TRINITY_DN10232_c0_g1_i1.p1 TRINITY_DN10232_c0_g1~~TRINITY_DN10232_c0_g1_i1.p1  ORF type:complete len:414 (+),score=71.66 TRINITY_DN10232_c0_g1_i1:373-1614(+)